MLAPFAYQSVIEVFASVLPVIVDYQVGDVFEVGLAFFPPHVLESVRLRKPAYCLRADGISNRSVHPFCHFLHACFASRLRHCPIIRVKKFAFSVFHDVLRQVGFQISVGVGQALRDLHVFVVHIKQNYVVYGKQTHVHWLAVAFAFEPHIVICGNTARQRIRLGDDRTTLHVEIIVVVDIDVLRVLVFS